MYCGKLDQRFLPPCVARSGLVFNLRLDLQQGVTANQRGPRIVAATPWR
jgi:hypothetical protein